MKPIYILLFDRRIAFVIKGFAGDPDSQDSLHDKLEVQGFTVEKIDTMGFEVSDGFARITIVVDGVTSQIITNGKLYAHILVLDK